MVIIITTDSCYSQWDTLCKAINSLPEGTLYHRMVDRNIDGKDHFFSDQPITDEVLAKEYE